MQFYDTKTPTAQLAVWAVVVPNGTMRYDVLLGRDSWMRFNTHTYTSLTDRLRLPTIGKLALGHFDGDDGTHTFTRDPIYKGAVFRVYNGGQEVPSLSREPQLI